MKAETMVKKTFNWTLIALLVVSAWLTIMHPDWIVGGLPAHASGLSFDKFDAQCTGTETAGRCADKCAGPNEFVRGFDKETGAAVCGVVTGCPYGDSVPLGPECDKLAPVYNEAQAIAPAPADEFAGK